MLRPFWRLFTAGAILVAMTGLATYGAVFLWNRQRPPVEKTPPAAETDPPALARQAHDILQTNCHRCHGKDGAMEGGFNYVLDRSRLIARKKIAPGQPEHSMLLRRVVDGEMPPADVQPRPGPDEVAVLRQWIESGAPEFGPSSPEPSTIRLADLPRLMRDDLAQRPERDRRFTRYFTLANLHNAGLAADELETYRQALAKLLNSLSWGREVVTPQPVDPEKTLLRIDLRDYKWTEAMWERLLADYPYGVAADEDAHAVADLCQCGLPCVRVDWFTAVASRPPLYYELLKLPATAGELEALLHVDAAEDVRAERVARAGFNDSGVSRNNRVIERHESSYGAYWKSYDFDGGAGTKNIFAHPLGPVDAADSFTPDGGEIIFDLPNGLHGFYLADGAGKRLDQARIAIVSDPKRPEHAVIAGISCMSCHAHGLNDKADQVRDHVQKNADAFSKDEADSVLALYPPHDRFEALLRADNDRYRTALEKTGGRAERSDPVAALTARFEADLDLAQAAAEMGVRPAELADALAATPALGRTLGSLRSEGGAAPRQQFIDSFAELLRALRLGEAFRSAELPVETAVKERVAVDLPEAFDQVKTGGGGRFLILYLKNAKKLAIFDVFQARIVHEIEVADDVRYAAGRDKLLVVSPGQKIVQRYDLHTFEREKSVPVPDGGTVITALMGSDSPGPLALWCGRDLILMDVDRMEAVHVPGNNFNSSTQWGFGLRVSADGQNFTGWNPSLWPANFAAMHLAGGKATAAAASLGSFNEEWVAPNADGGLMVRSDSHLLTGDLKGISADWLIGWVLLPTENPRFFLAARDLQISICTTSDRRPIFTITDKALQGMNGSSMPPRWFLFDRAEPRIRYLPGANLLAFIPQGDKQIVVRPFDLMSELDKGGQDYLFILSPPKTRVKAGETYSYRPEVKSKAGGLKYKLESGPDGMTVSGSGELRWDAPAAQAGKTAPVILTIRDAAGKELFHSFEVTAE